MTDISGIDVTMHAGLCEQYVKSLCPTASGFDLLFRRGTRAFWQQTPPEPILTPKMYQPLSQ